MRAQHLKRRLSDAVSSALLERRAREASARNGGSLWYVPDEAVTPNLIWQPESLNTGAVWGSTGSPTLTVGSQAPDGSMTATLFTRTITGPCYFNTALGKAAQALPGTFSIFVKQGTGRYCALRFQGNYPARVDAVFDLQTGTVASSPTVYSGFGSGAATISAVGGGWYRLTISATSDASTYFACYVTFSSSVIAIDGTDTAATATGYIWGAQAELSGAATPYIPLSRLGGATTSTEPQINVSFVDSAGTQPLSAIGQTVGLLTDRSPARQDAVLTITNNLTYSGDLTNAAWSKSGSISTGSADPFGGTSGTTITATGTNTLAYNQISNPVNAAPYTGVMTLKAGVGSPWVVLILFTTASVNGCRAWFNLSTGTVGTITTNGAATNVSASIIPAGNGYYQCQLSCTPNGSDTTLRLEMDFAPSDNNYASTVGDTRLIYRAGLFLGTLTAAQIAACGIPLTTTAAASTSSYAVAPAANNLGPNLAPATSSTSGWTAQTSTLSAAGSSLTVTNSGAAEGYATFGSAQAGVTYLVSVVVTSGNFTLSAGGGSRINPGSAGYYRFLWTPSGSGWFGISTTSAVSGASLVISSLTIQQVYTVSPNAALNLGPELITNNPGGPFTSTTGWVANGTGAALALSGSELQLTSTTTSGTNRIELGVSGLTVGRTYKVTVQARLGTAASGLVHTIGDSSVGWIQTSNDVSITGITSAPYTFTFVANSPTGFLQFITQVTGTLFVGSASIKPVLGTTASQSTAANRPLLTQVPRKLGAELSKNPGAPFATTTGWGTSSTTNAVSSGEIVITSTIAAGGNNYQDAILIPGVTYRAVVTLRNISAGSGVFAQVQRGAAGSYAAIAISATVTSTTATTVVLTFVAPASDAQLVVQINATAIGQQVAFSSFSLKQVLSWAPALSFDGVNDTLTCTPPPITTACTLVWAGVVSNLSSAYKLIEGASGGVGIQVNQNGAAFLDRNGTGVIVASGNGLVAPGTPAVISAQLQLGGTAVIRINGQQVASAAFTGAALTATVLGLMADGSTNFAPGTLSLAHASNTILPLADLRAIEAYAADRCGAVLTP